MKKIMMIVTMTLLVSLLPGVAMAGGGVPPGVTLKSWVVGPNGGHAAIGFVYSDGFSTDIGLDIPLDPSWHTINDVRPILEAYKEGYGPNLGGSGGIMGTTINYAPNVLAAMKVQNFNPSQVGGSNIPPSSTTITPDQTAWLEKIGYTVQSAIQPESSPVQTKSSTPTGTTKAPSNQAQTSAPVVTPTQSSTESPATPPKVSQKVTPPKSEPAVGETVKTSSGPMTEEMIAANQELVAQNPPNLNPANIPGKEPAKIETGHQGIPWSWVVAGGGILVLVCIVGLVLYRRHRMV